MPQLFVRCLILSLVACLALAGCRREVVAPGDPVAAVKGMAAAVRDNDLVRYSRLSMPPKLHQQMEARWKAKLIAAPAPTAEQRRDYARWMVRLTAADAETRLYQRFDARLKKVEGEIGSQWPLMQATGGIFINGLIKANDQLSPGEKDHAQAVGSALLAWVTPALLSDRARARQAIAVTTRTARELQLPTLQETRELEMIPALEKGGQVLKGLKQIGRIYGLDADASLAGVQARVVSAEGDLATLEVSYPFLDRTVKFDMQLIRRDGRWYNADAVREAEAELAQPLVAMQPATP
ncbi:MAG: hypothetical protein WC213_06635 [Arenimonas sp.]|jgi:uncharacterized membrane protein